MYTVIVNCEVGPTVAGGGCIRAGMGWVTEDLTEPIPEKTRASILGAGWVERDGKFWCPRHDPQEVGTEIQIGQTYTEIAPGVRVRVPVSHYEEVATIEVQREDRECHGHVGAICGGGNGPYGR